MHCLYDFAEEVVEPNTLRMSELWQDRDALDRFLGSDEFNGVRRRVRALQILEGSVQK
jgi:quinol monooxygenase YgiN